MKEEFDNFLFNSTVDKKKYFIAKYFIKSNNMLKAAKGIAIGQSIGNPDVRLDNETAELLENHLSIILDHPDNLKNKKEAIVKIAFPVKNFDLEQDGITQFICALMGGQMDIEEILHCRLLDVELPEVFIENFKGPKIGMDEIKKRTNAINRPLLGGIVKPKTGLDIKTLKEVCIKMVKGGVDFIKEDEILGNPSCCPFEERVKVVNDVVQNEAAKLNKEVFYAPCVNSDLPYLLNRIEFLVENKIKAYHLNIWTGLQIYKYIRSFDFNIAMFYQKSGDRVITDKNNAYSISWNVLLKLARISGADFIHAGMWGGYLSDTKEDLTNWMSILTSTNENGFKKTVPSFSCGSHPGLVQTTVKNFGDDLMMSLGGQMHGHPSGTTAGAKAMRQAFDLLNKDKSNEINLPEYKEAIEKWGLISD
ncbi:RuBisCO large subunit C-terminal-like domain-containing protein [Candidatus Pelagibacter sp.]|nr:RuBisCO large subunit C-terminal-like domain-containing protein [Candidatus Pelagibacter sp.]